MKLNKLFRKKSGADKKEAIQKTDKNENKTNDRVSSFDKLREDIVRVFFNESDFEGFPLDMSLTFDDKRVGSYNWIADERTAKLLSMLDEFAVQLHQVCDDVGQISKRNMERCSEALDSFNGSISFSGSKNFELPECENNSSSMILSELEKKRDEVRNSCSIGEGYLKFANPSMLLMEIDTAFILLKGNIFYDPSFKFE